MGHYRLVSLTLVSGEITEGVLLEHISGQKEKMIGNSQLDLPKVNLIALYVSKFEDERKAVDVIYLGFSKVFNTVSHSILLSKLQCITVWMCEQPNGLKLVG